MHVSNRSRYLLKMAGHLLHRRPPGQLIIQMTDRCNASCPQCGMRVSNPFARKRIPDDDIKRIIDAAAQNGVDALSFTGGEPMLEMERLLGLIQYAGKAGIRFIRTGTNGFFLRGSRRDPSRFLNRITGIAAQMAATPLRNFWISLDSCVPEIHEQMRGFPGVVRGIEKALPLFHDHGIYPSVNLGINRNVGGRRTAELHLRDYTNPGQYLSVFYRRYLEAFRRFYQQAIDLGFTILNTCYPMSIDAGKTDGLEAVYAATASDRVVRFSAAEKALLFGALMECVAEFRDRIRIFSPLTSLYMLQRTYRNHPPGHFEAAPCRGGIDFFFIDAQTGETFPCGYRGSDSFGKYWELDMKKTDTRSVCRRCDWECFRDPSELFAPFSQLVCQPVRLLERIRHDSRYLRFWLSDLRYYAACDFFDGRRPTDPERIKRFSCFSQKQNMPIPSELTETVSASCR